MTVRRSLVKSILPVALGHDPTASMCPWVQVSRSTADYPSRKAQIAVALLNGQLPPSGDVVDLMYRCDGLCRCQPQPGKPFPTPYTNLIHDARANLVAGGHVPNSEEWATNWRDYRSVYGRIELDKFLFDRSSQGSAMLYVPGTASLVLDPQSVVANLRLLTLAFGSVKIDPELLDTGYVLRELGLHMEWEAERERVREHVEQGGYRSIVTTTPREAMGIATALGDRSISVTTVVDSLDTWTSSMRSNFRSPAPGTAFAHQPTEEMIADRESVIILLEKLAAWNQREIVTLTPEATSPAAIERPVLPSSEEIVRSFAERRGRELLEFHEGENLVVLTFDPFSRRALIDQLGERARVVNFAAFLCEHLENGHAHVLAGRLHGALIGAGNIAQYHLAAWQRIPEVEIAAISNRTISRARELALRFDITPDRIYPSTAELLANERQLDFVDIVTAPELHRADVEQAATGGVPHILCQKPLAPALDDALAMREVTRCYGSTLTTNENWRWRPWYRHLKEVLNSGRLGEPRYTRITAHHNVALGHAGAPPPILERQSYTVSMSHFLVMEWGVHLIDTLRMLFGEPQWVHATMSQASPYFSGEDRAVISLGFGGIITSIDISWATQSAPSPPTLLEETTIEGDSGTITLIPNRGDGDLIRLVEALPLESLPVDRERPWSPVAVTSTPAHDGNIAAVYQQSFTAAHRHYVESWLSGRLPETHIGDNLRTMEVMFAAYRSAETNEVIRLEGTSVFDESS